MIAPKQWVLLAIAAADREPLSPAQLQKALFIVGRELPTAVGEGFYDFHPCSYGPFDPAVFRDAEALAFDGLVRIRRPHHQGAEYAATPAGMRAAGELQSDAATEYLKQVVQWAHGLSFQDLVRAVNARYPDMMLPRALPSR